MKRIGKIDWACLLAILVVGSALRLIHLGTPSLWWDEFVQIRTSLAGSVLDVLREVKRGVPPGSGNAGAVPLDYVLFHLYLSAVPAPPPQYLEIYYRLPAFLYSCASLVLLFVYALRFFGRPIAVLATLLLAFSIPHILYAAEARFYSLFVLASIANLFAFSQVVENRTSVRAWIAFSIVNVAYFFCGLLSVLVFAWEYAILLGVAIAARRRRAEWSRVDLVFLAGSAAIVLIAVGAYIDGASFTVRHGRPAHLTMRPWSIAWDTWLYLSSDNPFLFALLLAVPLPLLYARRHGLLPIVLNLECALLSIPLIVLLEKWKEYYFHSRHALFLLPSVVLLIAITLHAAVRALQPSRLVFRNVRRREAADLLLAVCFVTAVQLPSLRAYVTRPAPFFARSKTLRDFKAVTQEIESRARSLRPGDKFLLVAERDSLANAGLAQYLKWYRLLDRVVLRTTSDPRAMLQRIEQRCRAGCRGGVLEQWLGLRAAIGLHPDFRRLLGLRGQVGGWPGRVQRSGALLYSPGDGPVQPGVSQRRYRGIVLLESSPRDARGGPPLTVHSEHPKP